MKRAATNKMLTQAFGIAALTLILYSPTAHATVPVPLLAYIAGTDAADAETIASSSPAIHIAREDVVEFHAASPAPENVTTQADLIVYAQALVHDDTDIEHIDITDTSVSMTYIEHVTVMGITKEAETTATVYADGKVKVDKPFWLSVVENDEDQASGFSDILMSGDDAGLYPNTVARILMRLYGRFQIDAI